MRPLVLKVGGVLLDTPQAMDNLLTALAHYRTQHQRAIVIVHGGGIVVDNLMLALSRQKLTVPAGDKTIVITYDPGNLKKAIQEAMELRNKGKKVALCPAKEEQD